MNLLNLNYQTNRLILEAVDEKGDTLIHQPLHRIFLRSSLSSDEINNTYSWTILSQEELLNTLERLISHFERYNIVIDLDVKCREILDTKKKSEKEFRHLLKIGLKLKRDKSLEAREYISSLLSPEFHRELKDFQLDAVNHLFSIGNGANFSVPGSGKTSVALAYYKILSDLKRVDALFVIGPASSFEPWEHEYVKCFGKESNSIRIAGFSKVRRNELYLMSDRFNMILTTYYSTTRDLTQIIGSLKRRNYLLVLDESHYIKRPQGGKIAETILKLSRYGKYRVILTGTPMPNSLEDLWSQFAFLWGDSSPLGSVSNYLREIRGSKTDTSIKTVKSKIDPLFWRVTKKQLNLPKIEFKTIHCPLSPLQSRIYEGIAIRFLSELKEEPRNKDILREWRRSRAIRLLQVASNPALLRQQCEEFSLPPMELGQFSLKQGIEYYGHYEVPNKIIIIEKLIKEICDKGNKVIVWTSFIHNLKMLAYMLSSYFPVSIHGSVPITSNDKDELTRERLIIKFKTDPTCKLLLANPAACAESISLHDVCHHAIYLDRTFNCAHYLQSLDRIHRIGLSPNQITSYYLLCSENTIDNIINTRLSEKMKNMERVLEDDLPGLVPGYWVDQLGDEEEFDFDLVENHIKTYLSKQ